MTNRARERGMGKYAMRRALLFLPTLLLGDFLKRMSLMAIASPQRGEVGGGNCVGRDLAAARLPAAPPPTWPPPAGGFLG